MEINQKKILRLKKFRLKVRKFHKFEAIINASTLNAANSIREILPFFFSLP